jgi:hypothetical protein
VRGVRPARARQELEPRYIDVAVKRWEAFTKKTALLAGGERSWAEVADARMQQLE